MEMETLEPRRLLAGVTIITHGLDGNVTDWVADAADAIQKRAGGTSAASEYTMVVNEDSKNNLQVASFTLDKGNKPITETTDAQMIVKLDWSTVSDGTVLTQDVASVVASYIEKGHGDIPTLTSMPIHLIGHSRGGSLMVALSQDLGDHGIWVDQLTTLDPVPIDVKLPFGITYSDAKLATYDNVIFADNYWRTDNDSSNADPDGNPVPGAHNVNLDNTVQKNFIGSAHESVTSYYQGTIDTSAQSNSVGAIFASWYKSPNPSRTETGFAFTKIAAGNPPLDGVSSLFDGTADRSTAGNDGAQWANAINVRNTGGSHFNVGQRVKIKATYDNRSGNAHLAWFLDTDQDPYNNNSARTMGRKSGGEVATPSGIVTTGSTSGIAPGTYYIGVQVSDNAGHVRYVYGTKTITFRATATSSAKVSSATVSATSIFAAGNTKIEPIDASVLE
jgi:hypothetical protein